MNFKKLLAEFRASKTPEELARLDTIDADRVARICGVVWAVDSAGNQFKKIVHLSPDLLALCFGGPVSYRLKDLVDWVAGSDAQPRSKLCIDAMGLNHRGRPDVSVDWSDVDRMILRALDIRSGLQDKSRYTDVLCCPLESEAKMAIWPKRIEVLGLTGEYASGKTLFGLMIDPRNTLLYDAEKSAGSYEGLGFTRVDLPAEMLRRKPGGYKPEDLFTFWLSHVRSLPTDRYSVIGLDPVSEIESGLADYVMSHPAEFGKTAAQYARSAGLFWGDVKELWKQVLCELASRCQTFYFTAHMGAEFAGGQPIPGKRKAKGKETLMELASLYLQLQRTPDTNGLIRAEPSAIVRKSRLAEARIVNGKPQVIPLLPPRLELATPDQIREYMQSPPDYSALKSGELAPAEVLTEDDRAQIKLATAQAENETALNRLELAKLTGATPIGDQPQNQTPAQSGRGFRPSEDQGAALEQVFSGNVTVNVPPGTDPKEVSQEVLNTLNRRFAQPAPAPAPSEPAAQPSQPSAPPAEMIAPGFRYPVTPAIRGFLQEVQGRDSLDNLAPLFKSPPTAELEWERFSMIVGMCLRGIRVAKNRAEITRVMTWLSKQPQPVVHACTQIVREYGNTRWGQLA